MKKIAIIYTTIWCLAGYASFGQDNEALFSQYWSNGLAINPAYAGARDVFNVSVFYQRKWTGVDGSPMNMTFSAHAPTKKNNIGLGVYVVNQSYGVRRNTQAHFSYAYRIIMGEAIFSLGLRAGASFVYEDLSSLQLADPNDPAFTGIEKNQFQPNVGFGAYYYTPRYFVGLSMPDMMSYYIQADTISGSYRMSVSPKYYTYMLTGGTIVNITPGLKWKPSALLAYRMDYKALRIDINSSFIFLDDRLWVGAGYRTGGAVASSVIIGNLQVNVTPQFMLGYSFDYSLSNINNVMNGVHEIMLRYEFGYKVKAANPRFF